MHTANLVLGQGQVVAVLRAAQQLCSITNNQICAVIWDMCKEVYPPFTALLWKQGKSQLERWFVSRKASSNQRCGAGFCSLSWLGGTGRAFQPLSPPQASLGMELGPALLASACLASQRQHD